MKPLNNGTSGPDRAIPLGPFDAETVLRFVSHVRVSAGSNCVEWVGAIIKGGYGAMYVNGRQRPVHRIAYAIRNGELPSGALVRHACDNRSCVNPDHLLLGRDSDNVRDMVERRGPNIVRGERQGRAKLTDADVIEIRRRRAFGEKTRDIANAFGISNPNVTRICLRHNWKHV